MLALIVTGMPGAQRLMIVFLIQYEYGLEVLGKFTNDISIVFMITLFTAIGWANLILVRVPAARSRERLAVVRELMRYILPTIAVGGCAIAILGYMNRAFEPGSMIVVLIGWTGYQLVRHYLISVSEYEIILRIDAACTGCIALLLAGPLTFLNPLLCMGVPLGAISMWGWIQVERGAKGIKYEKCQARNNSCRSGLEFGLTNFLNEGMTLLLGPISAMAAGVAYAGVIGLITAFLSIVLLFPRALTMHYMPRLAVADKEERKTFFEVFRAYRRYLHVMVVAMAFGAVIVGIIISWYIDERGMGVERAWAILLLVLANAVVNQMALPDSVRLIVKEKSQLMVRINATTFVAYGMLLFTLTNSQSGITFLLTLLSGQGMIGLMRLGLLRHFAGRMQYGR
ncbi:MAG: hypothetical protein NFCOHLIN_02963 [Gammaproteobacteria bacterium]|nr:hypothetical protein [Gammaproteobacteria bacterium]